ncbi:MAG: hypothetical protein E6R08_06240 [Nevskiaceae bacterium]|nr:MAG: hypothetical protein E6R08_06240 [Nevskiaceae bacterium]
MAQFIKLEAPKTYATEENAIKAVEKKFPSENNDGLTYIMGRTEDGRFFPIFIGERAIQAGVHFTFHVVA